jgi:DNA-directed RNA polymerase beta subunit
VERSTPPDDKETSPARAHGGNPLGCCAQRNQSHHHPKNGRGASRLSFAKISDTLTVPDLLALQTESFDWLVGNDAWKARVAEAKAVGRTDVPETSGLEEIFEEISPIEDLGETMQLSFTNPYLEPRSTRSRSARSAARPTPPRCTSRPSS